MHGKKKIRYNAPKGQNAKDKRTCGCTHSIIKPHTNGSITLSPTTLFRKDYYILAVILRENQADSMESQFLGYMEISQSIRKSKVLMSKT